jgi:WhiB family transcriptional regulator, redox-sensing transcriptional regulator
VSTATTRVTCRPTVRRPSTAKSGAGAAGASAEPPSLRLPCRVDDPDLWFAESPVELEQAKALCAGCPIRRNCLSAALDRREPWGVWGGEIFEQGVVIARKRPRGRPRKVAVIA